MLSHPVPFSMLPLLPPRQTGALAQHTRYPINKRPFLVRARAATKISALPWAPCQSAVYVTAPQVYPWPPLVRPKGPAAGLPFDSKRVLSYQHTQVLHFCLGVLYDSAAFGDKRSNFFVWPFCLPPVLWAHTGKTAVFLLLFSRFREN